MQLTRHTLILWSALIVSGCGNIGAALPRTSSTCSAGSAALLVNDASLQILCGCDEPPGTLAVAGSSLTCTLPINTVVTFFFAGGTRNLHQIVSVGSPTFASSPIFDPFSETPVRAHSVSLGALATYAFRDAINTAISGSLITR